MYGKTEYHETQCDEFVRKVEAMFAELEAETADILLRRYPRQEPNRFVRGVMGRADNNERVENALVESQRLALQGQSPSGLLSGLFGGLGQSSTVCGLGVKYKL